MEIDPEVAALLDDLPRTKLPEVLVEAGWGHNTMADIQRVSVWNKTKKPSTTFQPIFDETCVQCGRPVTYTDRQMWKDHAGRTVCEADLIEERIADYHIAKRDQEVIKESIARRTAIQKQVDRLFKKMGVT